MALATYIKKRDFKRTQEPRGSRRVSKGGQSFVVQKHDASHLHYDFRLEWDGVLLSWAIPKGPSLDPHDKRLAIQVEDHPVEYGSFEGTIPQGQYGGGTVMVWDRGTWLPHGDAAAGLREGNLKFSLHGDKLHGRWALVRTRGSKFGGKTGDRAWLLIKERDDFASAGTSSIVDRKPESAQSGRNMDQIAGAEKRTQGTAAGSGKKGRMPPFVEPELATLVQEPPEGNEWIHEIKFDGYRMLCRIQSGKATLFSRNAKDWTRNLPVLAKAMAALPVVNAWIDGEVVILDDAGRSDFQALQNVLNDGNAEQAVFIAFDIMYLDGQDLRGLPLAERKVKLRGVVADGGSAVRLGPEVRGGGGQFFKQATQLQLEGIVSKNAGSIYASGKRTRNWLKIKATRSQEMVIGGYTDPQGTRTAFGALLLGHYDEGELRYAGKVGTGFDDALLRKLLPKLKRLATQQPAFVNPPRGFSAKGVHWIKPELVADISFTEWSNDGALRHPVFKGIRVDKKATDVGRERATPPIATRTAHAKSPSTATVKLSHPDKLYFPEAGISKADLASYYSTVAPRLLPHLAGRPLSLVRCPDGWNAQCFYQKHAAAAVSSVVRRIKVPEGAGNATYLRADSADALVALVQWGVIELHPWGSALPRLDRADRLIFDFDPDDKLPWKELVTALGLLRTLLDKLKLQGFLKTTGGKGLHVVVPIRPTLAWSDAKAFTEGVAQFLASTFPDRFTASLSRDRRKGRIFIDYLRNAEGATAVAPYAVRARANAPVSTPIAWEELRTDVRFDHFTVANVPLRVSGRAVDPWAEFFSVKQSVSAAIRRRFAAL